MNIAPNFLHVVLLACALPCVQFTLSEMRHRSLPRWRLSTPPLLALAAALVFLLFQLGNEQAPWSFGAALSAGLTVGALRGMTLKFQVDQISESVCLPWARGSFLVALALVGAVLIEIGGAFAGEAGTSFRLVAPDIAAACAGVLTGRMIAVMVRWQGVRLPSVPELHESAVKPISFTIGPQRS